jgi:hypothetical protein
MHADSRFPHSIVLVGFAVLTELVKPLANPASSTQRRSRMVFHRYENASELPSLAPFLYERSDEIFRM